MPRPTRLGIFRYDACAKFGYVWDSLDYFSPNRFLDLRVDRHIALSPHKSHRPLFVLCGDTMYQQLEGAPCGPLAVATQRLPISNKQDGVRTISDPPSASALGRIAIHGPFLEPFPRRIGE
jgi:hypothetical protein